MGHSEKSRPRHDTTESTDSLPALVGRLGEDITTLLDTKLALLKVELKEDATTYVRSGLALTAGGGVVALGFGFASVAIALIVAVLFEQTQLSLLAKCSLGFLVMGVVYLIAGTVVLRSARRRLAEVVPGPEKSVKELARDQAWLTSDKHDG